MKRLLEIISKFVPNPWQCVIYKMIEDFILGKNKIDTRAILGKIYDWAPEIYHDEIRTLLNCIKDEPIKLPSK